ncbi:hypothetical protein WR25_05064 isoform D [Diploscapter pachys]|uniref:Uncharacterized protein n=1 Tax=Diploscapter pachys TaxID=2018661 RepID=A0A2A2K5T4_9BILA|nr:hypothetical protein WR25_05064 isoform D [Diploscapter pachys]
MQEYMKRGYPNTPFMHNQVYREFTLFKISELQKFKLTRYDNFSTCSVSEDDVSGRCGSTEEEHVSPSTSLFPAQFLFPPVVTTPGLDAGLAIPGLNDAAALQNAYMLLLSQQLNMSNAAANRFQTDSASRNPLLSPPFNLLASLSSGSPNLASLGRISHPLALSPNSLNLQKKQSRPTFNGQQVCSLR